jgi:hypothetical protein
MYERLRRELATVPGVARVGLVHPTLPPWDGHRTLVRLEGVDAPHAPDGLRVGVHLADEGLLPMLGVAIVAGRNIEAGDARSAVPVAVVSEALAKRFGGAERALGRSITFPGDDPEGPAGAFRVVGVVADIAYDGFVDEETRLFPAHDARADVRAARYDVYVPLARFPARVVSIGASTVGDPAAVLEALRRRLASIAPASAVHWTSTMDEEIAVEYEPARFYAIIVMAFSTGALALTGAGLFALLSHAAARRAGEMGLRLALGATPASTARLLLRDALLPLAGGCAIGLAAALLAGRAMSRLLFGIGSFDTVAFSGASAVLLVVALGAALAPARRVASTDPVRALRSD